MFKTEISKTDNTTARIPILLVDDSRTVRAGLSKALRSSYEVVEAVDGEDGWQQLQTNDSIKLVISDIMMPNLDGYGLICRIRGSDQDRIKDLPIIVVTSAEDDKSRKRAYACGANNFIVKPAATVDLLERVKFHAQAQTSSSPITAPQMAEYESQIESAVIEMPDLETALEILKNGESGSLSPYAIDLARRVLPLLQYCNEAFELDAEDEIKLLEYKLKSI